MRRSDLDWTIVRAAYLTNGRRTGRYRVARDYTPPRGWRIARADVADFMLKELADARFVSATAAIAY